MSFERFWSHELNPELAMQPFTWQHYSLILLGVLSVILTLKYAKKIKAHKWFTYYKILFILWLLSLELIYHLHYWSHGMFSVPLHICSFGVLFSVITLITDSKKSFGFLFFIGILGGLTALFIPNSLGYTYYNVRYYHFILLHVSIVIVPIFYYKAYNYEVKLKYLYYTSILILLIMPIVTMVNYLYNKNYMFIGERPEIIERFLPVWPYYIPVMIVLAFITMHILFLISKFKVKYITDKFL